MNATTESNPATTAQPKLGLADRPTASKATMTRVAKAEKAAKTAPKTTATEPEDAVLAGIAKVARVRPEDPRRNAIRELIAQGKNVPEIAKALGYRRGLVRRTLTAELQKIGATYVAGIRLVDGKAVLPTKTVRTRKAKADRPEIEIVFGRRDVTLPTGAEAIEIYHLATGKAIGTLRKNTKLDVDDILYGASRLAGMGKLKLTAVAAGRDEEARLAGAVLKVLG